MVMSLGRGLLALSCTLAAKPAWAACESGQETTITQYGITFTFDTPTSCGQFANGDYWVAPASAGGKVTLTALAPDFNGSENGFEINPADKNAQGFDSRITGFDATLVPALPYAAAQRRTLQRSAPAHRPRRDALGARRNEGGTGWSGPRCLRRVRAVVLE